MKMKAEYNKFVCFFCRVRLTLYKGREKKDNYVSFPVFYLLL